MKPPTVEVLELLAARRAVSFTAESGFTNFIYEGDFDSAVQSIRSKGMENSQGMHLIKDIQSHVNSFQSISFSHVVRQDNAATHALIQKAKLYFPLLIWLKSVPPDILSFILFDFSNS